MKDNCSSASSSAGSSEDLLPPNSTAILQAWDDGEYDDDQYDHAKPTEIVAHGVSVYDNGINSVRADNETEEQIIMTMSHTKYRKTRGRQYLCAYLQQRKWKRMIVLSAAVALLIVSAAMLIFTAVKERSRTAAAAMTGVTDVGLYGSETANGGEGEVGRDKGRIKSHSHDRGGGDSLVEDDADADIEDESKAEVMSDVQTSNGYKDEIVTEDTSASAIITTKTVIATSTILDVNLPSSITSDLTSTELPMTTTELPLTTSTGSLRTKTPLPTITTTELPTATTTHRTVDPTCVGDRFAHGVPLHNDEYLCSKKGGRFKLGLSADGDFVWIDKETGETKQHFRERNKSKRHHWNEGNYLLLHANGTLAVYNETGDGVTPKWQKDSIQLVPFVTDCLQGYECPYLHLHSGGVCVLNWIDESGKWNERRIQKVYGF